MTPLSPYPIPPEWISIKTIDMHTGGEPLRVIIGGFPEVTGSGILDYRNFVKTNYDHLRKALMWEPRGHADMYGALLVPSQIADFGVIFMHNEGYSTMCGHATIALAKLAVEAKWIKASEPETRMTLEAPCGLIEAFAQVKGGQVISSRFTNVPSFVVALNEYLNIPGIGKVKYDIAYGGAFYAFVKARELGLRCIPEYYQELIQKGKAIKQAIIDTRGHPHHPSQEDLSFLYGTIFIDESDADGVHSRNVCVFADGELDRSPTGSGVSARLAIHHAREEVAVEESVTIESILGTAFTCKIVDTTTYQGYHSVIPSVEGTAFVTATNEFLIDPNDPLKEGFFLR